MEAAAFELDVGFVIAGAVCGALCVAGSTAWWHLAGPGGAAGASIQAHSTRATPGNPLHHSGMETGRSARSPAHAASPAQGKGAVGSEAERQYVQQSHDQECAHVVDLGPAARAVSRDGAQAMLGKGVLIRTLTQNEGSAISPGADSNRSTSKCTSLGHCRVLSLSTGTEIR